MANNPITVPLPQNLPETWATNQIVSPDGVSAGLTPQHGYNYLMQQVNNAQQAAQELGEGIAGLSGDNLPASSDGEETISAALSNKVSKSSDTPCPNLDEFVELYQYVNVTPDTENLPVETNLDFGSAINIGLSSGVMIQILYSRYGDIFVRGYAYWEIPKWKPWVPIVTATPPQEYDLPLADGLSAVNPCTYRKNQFGEVSVGGAASGTIEVGTTIATLPSGFRPTKTVERPAVYSVNGAWAAGTIVVTTDGIVRAYGQTSATSVAFAVDFVAAD